ncbi:B12-binding domain-containing radical SAM protein [Roseibium suaedae]|uniref:Radical SAM superfamily enzyme YgiQ, UPF0313 family n=1 Tax=Roseibium suaedae TaxID=735517 RepID=A0A1M7P534_9HYPH|nr:radical SAM protein [Roseibium suaedae]SHN11753.1 Radical SAM superfamily enzyme YgiQ, UPF0313 family [Roseibium suaedae]
MTTASPKKRMLIIAPLSSFSADRTAERTRDRVIMSDEPVVRVASLAIATVAALIPDGLFDITLCDEEIEFVDLDIDVDVVAITANVSQAQRAIWMAKEFRSKGKTVIIGGPHVSLAPEIFEGVADAMVVGELEPIAEKFFTDLHEGRLEAKYQGHKADMSTTPMPRWDLYPNSRAVSGVVQTSRGCPFECNFCDVIQYLGRVQRHKPDEQILAEISRLYEIGYRHITLSDDNFTVYRKRSKALLTLLKNWNGAEGREPVSFQTQMSIDVARDPELLALCNEAGLRLGFFGIESSSAEALTESKKRQNLRVDLREECEKIVRAGVIPEAGLIVGFDSDGPDCFQRQFDFAMSLPVITFKVAVLVAPISTPLYDEMAKAGRIIESDISAQFPGGSDYQTNIIPARMSREELAEGARWLFESLLRPENVLVRFKRLAELLQPAPWARDDPSHRVSVRPNISRAYLSVIAKWSRDASIRNLIGQVRDLAQERPEIKNDLMDSLSHYLVVYDGIFSTDDRRQLPRSVSRA